MSWMHQTHLCNLSLSTLLFSATRARCVVWRLRARQLEEVSWCAVLDIKISITWWGLSLGMAALNLTTNESTMIFIDKLFNIYWTSYYTQAQGLYWENVAWDLSFWEYPFFATQPYFNITQEKLAVRHFLSNYGKDFLYISHSPPVSNFLENATLNLFSNFAIVKTTRSGQRSQHHIPAYSVSCKMGYDVIE